MFPPLKRAFARMKHIFARQKRAFARVKYAFARKKRAFARLTQTFFRMKRVFALTEHRYQRLDTATPVSRCDKRTPLEYDWSMHDLPNRVGKQEDDLCAQCSNLTMHSVLASYKTSWDNDEAGISGGATHEFLRCNGCGAGTYRTESWFSEEPGETSVRLYPPRGETKRQTREWYELPVDNNLEQAYKQTLAAFNAGLFTLAGAGVRLVIEGVCIDQKVIDGPKLDPAGKPIISKKSGKPVRSDNLEGKINGLAEQSFISSKQAAHLHQIRFLGNDAAHQLDIPTAKVLGLAIDITEHLLEQVYEQPAKAKSLAARKRPKR